MSEVTFSKVAPVIPVKDLNRALRRYRLLGFSTRAYEGPARYGYVERNGVEMHLSESPNTIATMAPSCTSTSPMPTLFTLPGQPLVEVIAMCSNPSPGISRLLKTVD